VPGNEVLGTFKGDRSNPTVGAVLMGIRFEEIGTLIKENNVGHLRLEKPGQAHEDVLYGLIDSEIGIDDLEGFEEKAFFAVKRTGVVIWHIGYIGGTSGGPRPSHPQTRNLIGF
jgi:hypothetical protein